MTVAALDRLCADASALGCRLFTLSAADPSLTVFIRIYSSHPAEYPLAGTKPIARDAWFAHVITGRQSFLANTPAEFETLFPDHALITAMGLGSCLNIPVFAGARLAGCANFLAETGHFTPRRLNEYHTMTAAAQGILAAMMMAAAAAPS